MTSEKGLSQVVSKLLLFHGEEFRRVFYEKANDSGFIDLKTYKRLIDEMGYLLPAYHKEVKAVFWEQNKKALKDYNLTAISYIDFLEILSILLKSPNQDMREIRIMIARLNRLLKGCKDETESRLIENVLDGLYQRLYELKNTREGLSPEEIEDYEECNRRDTLRRQGRLRALRELFGNYCKKAISLVKRHGSFDAINLQTQGMSLENFSCLLKDLKVRVEAQKVTSHFNKTKQSGPFLNFEEFCILIEKVAPYADLIDDADNKPTGPIKSYRPDSYKNSSLPVIIMKNKSKAEDVEDWKGSNDPSVKAELFWIHTGIENGTVP